MRCKACDVILQGSELVRKSVLLGDYLDLCNKCYKPIEHEVATTEGSNGDESKK